MPRQVKFPFGGGQNFGHPFARRDFSRTAGTHLDRQSVGRHHIDTIGLVSSNAINFINGLTFNTHPLYARESRARTGGRMCLSRPKGGP